MRCGGTLVSSVRVTASEDYSAMERGAARKIKSESQKVRAIDEGDIDIVLAMSLC